MTLAATVKSSVALTQTVSGDLEAGTSQVNTTHSLSYSDGAGANQANLQWSDRRSLDASASEDLDMAGSLTGLLGAAVFARIKYIRVTAAASNTNNVNFASKASTGVPGVFLALSDGVSIPPGGKFEWGSPGAAGAVVTASTGDLFTVTNSGSGTPVTYDIVVIGAAS